MIQSSLMLMDIQHTEYLPGCGAMNEAQPMRADTPLLSPPLSSLNSVFLRLCLYREGNNSLFSIRTHRHTHTSFSVFVTLSLLNHNTSRQSNVLNGRIILTANRESEHKQLGPHLCHISHVWFVTCDSLRRWSVTLVCKTPDYKTRSCVVWPRH